MKTAQALENQAEIVRLKFERKLRAKLRDAKAEWFELKSRSKKSPLKRTELHFRASLLHTDAWLRIMLSRLLGRIILELEKVKRTLPHE